ncbi:MAG: 2-oxoacid:acceptor oxidoreductase family protein [Chromatiales bacterium]|nr:2-oxoacid:acceptor oxidoreductase family protein [Chromatiales bacterium]
MIEIRIHGRGGQGNVVAAYLLAQAAFHQGMYCQAFPNFGAERRGAPVVAFVRLDDKPIRRRSQVREPAFLIVQDQALLNVPGVTSGLNPSGAILVNSTQDESWLNEHLGKTTVALPANAMAKEHLGRPVPNTALLSAFLSLTGLFPIDALKEALADRFKGELLERNARLVDVAAERVNAGIWNEAVHATST